MSTTAWLETAVGVVIIGSVFAIVFAALVMASRVDDAVVHDYAALIERERDFDATGYPNADLPAVNWKDQGHE